MEFIGLSKDLRQDHVQDEVLDRYEGDLEATVGTCLYCRIEGRGFNHAAGKCSPRFRWINAKNAAYQSQKSKGKEWIRRYVACWDCYQPQDICRVADPEHEESECRFPGMVIPLCDGVYCRPGGQAWLQKHFQRRFANELEYMLWFGEIASLRGTECIQANCVAVLHTRCMQAYSLV